MTTLNFVGGSSPGVSTSWTGYGKVYSTSAANGVALPTTARAAANGEKIVYVATAQCYYAGRGGSRQLRLGIGSAYSDWKTIGSDTSANASGQLTINGLFRNGGNQVVTIDENGTGGFYFGRSSSGSGSTDGYTTWGALSGSLVYYEVPSAPTMTSVVQSGTNNAVTVTWTAPTSNGGYSSSPTYVLQWAYNSSFTGATTIATGSSSLSYTISNLSYGSTVYVKVSATNAASAAAGTTSVYSSSASAYLVAPNLSLNGWASFGTVTNNTFTIQRTVVPALTPTLGILRTGTASATGGTYTTGSVGIAKTYTDLVIGRQYIVSGKAILTTAAMAGNIYRFAVVGIGNGTSVTLTSTTVGATIPSYTFTATSTTHTIRIELAETFTVTATGLQESVAFYNYALTRVATDLTYRLQDNLVTGSLVDHFDLATQSVGAHWWVDKTNVTQFVQDYNFAVSSATFSDVVSAGNIYYNSIETGYDTQDIVNQITLTNYGIRKAIQGNSETEGYDVEWVDSDSTSITNWGARSTDLDSNLRTVAVSKNLIERPSVENYLYEATSTNFFNSIEKPSEDASGAWAAFNGVSAWRLRAITSAGLTGGLIFADRVPVVAGTTYYGLSYAATKATPSTRARYRVEWYDENNAIISTSYGSYVSLTSFKTWYKLTWSGAAPAGAIYARITNVYDRSTGAAFAAGAMQWADAAYFGITNETDYFDGNTADTTTYLYSWDGTVDASTSTKYTNILDTRTAELLTKFSNPVVRVRSLTWNTAQNPTLAYTLDVGSFITVTFKGTTATYRIVGMSHDITPERWMNTLQVEKV